MKDINKDTPPDNKSVSTIPSLEIIDLDDIDMTDRNDIPFDKSVSDEFRAGNGSSNYTSSDDDSNSGSFLSKNLFKIFHVVLLLAAVCTIFFVVYRFSNWGTRVESSFDPNNIDTEFEAEVLDNILPQLIEPETDDGIRTVVTLGNAPFADGMGSTDNLAYLIGDLTDAIIYNCAVSNSFLAAAEPTFDAGREPMDAFNLYWLSTLITMNNNIIYERAFEAMGADTPEDALNAYSILSSLDFNNVDVLAIMYDASDYLDGRLISNPENTTDIQSFYGNMNASLDLIQETYPHIRIIVMSPTYAYAIDENGQYASSELYLYHEHPLSRYSGMLEISAAAHSVSFLDNFYGTVNEYEASDYLIDNVHLNLEGRKKLAERFVYALEYYDE